MSSESARLWPRYPSGGLEGRGATSTWGRTIGPQLACVAACSVLIPVGSWAQAAPGTTSTAFDPLCGSKAPIGCSVPAAAKALTPFYSEKFHAACAVHDYCYRYGWATYRRTKLDCDNRFLAHMQEICAQPDWLTLASGGVSLVECQERAQEFYAAVVAFGSSSYQQGTLKCAYEGFCPPGRFETTGRLKGCRCPRGEKVYSKPFKESAYCPGTVACPSSTFQTTGAYRGCYCPDGSKKEYLDPLSYKATCTKPCPPGRFDTTGQYHNCWCSAGSTKDYDEVSLKKYAECRGAPRQPCPPGKFDTTGAHHDCVCPAGSTKDYDELSFKKYAECKGATRQACPSGKFSTTGRHHNCACAGGTKKHYEGLFKKYARCK